MPSTDPAALLIDLTVSQRAETYEIKNGVGDYWWLSILKGLGGSSSATAAEPAQPKQIRWL